MNYSEKWKVERERKAYLALADGTVFHGVAFGAKKDALGEVVFNTGMCGYQEILTDPSYAGQFVTLTPAEVGNYGINAEDIESRKLFLSGLVIGDLTAPSNWRSEKSLDDYLKENGVPGIYGVDTRALTLHLRDHGNQKAFLYVGERGMGNGEREAVAKAREWEGLDGQDYAAKVTCEKGYEFKTGLTGLARLSGDMSTDPKNPVNLVNPVKRIVCYDFGVKTNILRSLASWAKVTVVPAKTPAEEVLKMKPDGVFLSNGPADPAAVTYAIENIKKLLGPLPIMGICLGHQLLSLACGAKTGRLKFGHHGCNHPVKNLATGHVEITSQNHNFAVLPAFSVQYHPESCPGPHDSKYLFDEFRKMVLAVQNV